MELLDLWRGDDGQRMPEVPWRHQDVVAPESSAFFPRFGFDRQVALVSEVN